MPSWLSDNPYLLAVLTLAAVLAYAWLCLFIARFIDFGTEDPFAYEGDEYPRHNLNLVWLERSAPPDLDDPVERMFRTLEDNMVWDSHLQVWRISDPSWQFDQHVSQALHLGNGHKFPHH